MVRWHCAQIRRRLMVLCSQMSIKTIFYSFINGVKSKWIVMGSWLFMVSKDPSKWWENRRDLIKHEQKQGNVYDKCWLHVLMELAMTNNKTIHKMIMYNFTKNNSMYLVKRKVGNYVKCEYYVILFTVRFFIYKLNFFQKRTKNWNYSFQVIVRNRKQDIIITKGSIWKKM